MAVPFVMPLASVTKLATRGGNTVQEDVVVGLRLDLEQRVLKRASDTQVARDDKAACVRYRDRA